MHGCVAVGEVGQRLVKADLVAGVRTADVILVGTPTYNFSIPSTLKAWIDQVAGQEFVHAELTLADVVPQMRRVVREPRP